MTTGERIRAARKMQGISQRALAKKLGISPQGIVQWENGTRNPKPETLKKIAIGLGVEPIDLIGENYLDSYIAVPKSKKNIPPKPKVSDMTKAINILKSLNKVGLKAAVRHLEELQQITNYYL